MAVTAERQIFGRKSLLAPDGVGGGAGNGATPLPIDASAAFLPRTESAESLPLYGKEILGTGLSHGSGKTLLLDVVRLGARVTVLTRNPDNLAPIIEEAKGLQEQGGLSKAIKVDQHIIAVQADFNNPESINRAGFMLEGDVHAAIHASAAGMEQFMTRDKFLGDLVRLRGIKKRDGKEAFERARDEVQRKLAGWVADALPQAMQVNYAGPKLLLHYLLDENTGHMRHGGKFINFASAWTDQVGQPGANVPYWYEVPVALPKQALDRETQRDESRLALEARGIFTYTVVGQVIDDTDVGKMFNTLIFPLMDEGEQESYRAQTKPMNTADMSRAVQIMLLADPNDPNIWTPGQPRKLYVLGPTNTQEEAQANIFRQIDPNHPMLTFKSPI